jgi:cytidylate kinase
MQEKYIITIARGYGSGGRTIGKMLAKELGISYYDREILRLASDDSGINEELFGKADEKLKNTLLFRIAKNIYKGELIPPDSDKFVSNDNLFNYQAKIMKELADKESCVIIGRCADFVLKDMPNLVRIFVHAPLEHCIDVVEETSSMNRKEIEQFILKTDKHRADYYNYYTGKDWNDARNYDLCLNTKEMSFEKCVEVVKNYIEVLGR